MLAKYLKVIEYGLENTRNHTKKKYALKPAPGIRDSAKYIYHV